MFGFVIRRVICWIDDEGGKGHTVGMYIGREVGGICDDHRPDAACRRHVPIHIAGPDQGGDER